MAERFWEKVEKSPRGCWLWQGSLLASGGYGAFNVNGGAARSHRVAWELTNGPIPDGLFVCHRCDTPACVRPGHLFLATAEENVRDMMAKKRGYWPGVRSPKRGEDSPSAKLTAEQVNAIRAEYAGGGTTQAALATRYGIHQVHISAIVRRHRWKHLP